MTKAEKMRQQFEAWVVAHWPDQSLGRFNDGFYHGHTVQCCWETWQASREAVVVELPSFDEYPASMERDMRESLRSAIEAQGLKGAP